jgi:hypothetical protein
VDISRIFKSHSMIVIGLLLCELMCTTPSFPQTFKPAVDDITRSLMGQQFLLKDQLSDSELSLGGHVTQENIAGLEIKEVLTDSKAGEALIAFYIKLYPTRSPYTPLGQFPRKPFLDKTIKVVLHGDIKYKQYDQGWRPLSREAMIPVWPVIGYEQAPAPQAQIPEKTVNEILSDRIKHRIPSHLPTTPQISPSVLQSLLTKFFYAYKQADVDGLLATVSLPFYFSEFILSNEKELRNQISLMGPDNRVYDFSLNYVAHASISDLNAGRFDLGKAKSQMLNTDIGVFCFISRKKKGSGRTMDGSELLVFMRNQSGGYRIIGFTDK